MKKKNLKIAIIGLGYVGLPLAIEFSKKRSLLGFDVKSNRIKQLNSKIDITGEVEKKDLKNAKNLIFTSDQKNLKSVNCFIIAVPTPINKNKTPDLRPLLKASKIVGKFLKKGDIVIYESTVYPGCTENDCVPILEKFSGLRFNKEFFCGYSPERINPGDKKHKLKDIVKITSGSTPKVANFVDSLYGEIILAGTYKAPSIKVAEAAKVIENTQRDLNIALINELTIIFDKMKLDTEAVLQAAGSKWNFLNFKPGLVGGHCIGVDPYYLTHQANKLGYHPKIILAGRNINDNMGNFVLKKLMRLMKQRSIKFKESRILIMGLTFKENCPDLRNSGMQKIIEKLATFNPIIDLYDPLANQDELSKLYGKKITNKLVSNLYDIVIIGVGHNRFKKFGIKNISKLCKAKHIIYDLKYLFKSSETDLRL